MKVTIRLLLLLTGLAIFGWFVHRADPREIGATLGLLGWLAPLVLVPYAFVYAVDTWGWLFAFGREFPASLSYRELFRIRWMGEAVNNVAPTAFIGGEAVKVYLLHKRGFSSSEVTASVVIGKTLQFLAHLLFLTMGAIASFQLLEKSLGSAMIVAILLVAGLVIGLFALQRHGLFAAAFALLDRMRIHWKKLEEHRASLLRVDRRILEFYRTERGHFWASLVAFAGGWLLDTLEILLVAHLMGIPMSWLQALVIEAFIGVAKGIGILTPGAIGIQETGIVLLCRFAGLPEAFGIAYAILRRGREVLYAGAGWLMIFYEESNVSGLASRILQSRREPPPAAGRHP